jgi:hypothetical protein
VANSNLLSISLEFFGRVIVGKNNELASQYFPNNFSFFEMDQSVLLIAYGIFGGYTMVQKFIFVVES